VDVRKKTRHSQRGESGAKKNRGIFTNSEPIWQHMKGSKKKRKTEPGVVPLWRQKVDGPDKTCVVGPHQGWPEDICPDSGKEGGWGELA